MKSFKNSVVAALAVSAFTLSGAHAASWQDSLNSAASQLSGSNAQPSGGMSVSSLTSLLNGSSGRDPVILRETEAGLRDQRR